MDFTRSESAVNVSRLRVFTFDNREKMLQRQRSFEFSRKSVRVSVRSRHFQLLQW